MLIDVVGADARGARGRESTRPRRSSSSEGATDIDFGPATNRARTALWDMRKGFFASGGAARPKGTAMMTEDVAAPIDRLADFVIDMRKLLDDHGYEDAIIFGHALAGNLHFQMSDDFAEPGLGRKVRSLFARTSASWSRCATGARSRPSTAPAAPSRPSSSANGAAPPIAIMQQIKPLFDPEGLLNPGVLITAEPDGAYRASEGDAARRSGDRPLHRMRLLRAGLPEPPADPVARASASS